MIERMTIASIFDCITFVINALIITLYRITLVD